MKGRTKTIISALVVAAIIAGVAIALRGHAGSGENIRYISRVVGYADISASVSETGTVNPVNQVAIGSEVSGTIRTLTVDYNSVVRKGQILATLDPTTFQAVVDSAQANLRLEQATLNSAQVNVGKMKALLDLANTTVQQDEPLAKQGLINQQQINTERTAAITAQQDYLTAQSSVKVAEAQVSVAQGQLAQAQYNLSKTVIVSPFAGIIMARNVNIGQTVASSLQTPTLFTLATNLTDMQVDTSVDEADVGSVRTGESAQITVTAYPNLPFAGTVSQVRVNPTTVQNVVTYDAVVAVHDSSGRLLPGMTAQVSIEVGKRSHALAVPVAAVLYRPLAARSAAQGSGLAGGGFGAGVVQSAGSASGSAVAGAPGSQVTLWVLRDGRPSPVQVVIGLSDGKNIEITSGNLQAGDQVVVAQYQGARPGASGRAPASGQARPTSASFAAPAAPKPGTAEGASLSGDPSGGSATSVAPSGAALRSGSSATDAGGGARKPRTWSGGGAGQPKSGRSAPNAAPPPGGSDNAAPSTDE